MDSEIHCFCQAHWEESNLETAQNSVFASQLEELEIKKQLEGKPAGGDRDLIKCYCCSETLW